MRTHKRKLNLVIYSATSGNATRRFVVFIREQGSVADKKRAGRHRSVANHENLAAVFESVTRSPKSQFAIGLLSLLCQKSSLHIIFYDRLQQPPPKSYDSMGVTFPASLRVVIILGVLNPGSDP